MVLKRVVTQSMAAPSSCTDSTSPTPRFTPLHPSLIVFYPPLFLFVCKLVCTVRKLDLCGLFKVKSNFKKRIFNHIIGKCSLWHPSSVAAADREQWCGSVLSPWSWASPQMHLHPHPHHDETLGPEMPHGLTVLCSVISVHPVWHLCTLLWHHGHGSLR